MIGFLSSLYNLLCWEKDSTGKTELMDMDLKLEDLKVAVEAFRPIPIMKFLVFLSCFIFVGSSGISSVSCGDVVNICCYSTSPADYQPNCYICPKNVYDNALMACVNATEMPKNITFKAANCMEKNCQIKMPEMPEAGGWEKYSSDEFYNSISKALKLFFSGGRATRSVDAKMLVRSKRSKPNIVLKVNTFVSGGPVEFADPEYM